MFHSFGWPEALIILTVILIVFGVGKLPQVGGALGKGIREFRKGRAGLLEAGEEEEQEEEEVKSKSKKKND
ncbi:MAG: twin-arginine translocase TatA/TatE family subunit [Dehalococcoidia bacterium]|nr:MAG: twin-arginine translocase TatA/TatE family subunit [Dehalococcoidia bacterium]